MQASFGHGIDPPTPEECPAVRALALKWLNNDLKAAEAGYAAEKAKLGPILHAVMSRMLSDEMLADVRGAQIAQLPQEEREPWVAFWIKVSVLREQTVSTQLHE